jgi:hypothetical protein
MSEIAKKNKRTAENVNGFFGRTLKRKDSRPLPTPQPIVE